MQHQINAVSVVLFTLTHQFLKTKTPNVMLQGLPKMKRDIYIFFFSFKTELWEWPLSTAMLMFL